MSRPNRTSSEEWPISVGDAETFARFERAGAPSRATFVFAHGAGGHMEDASMQALAAELLERGVDLVRFNFLYRASGGRAPDRMPLLQSCMRAVVERTCREIAPEVLIVGGRSMGGRTASVLAASGMPCDGLLLFAYPLHPAGRPEKLRDAHLPDVRVPVLCFNGTRDPLCTRELMETALAPISSLWTMHWLEGADHSFHVLRSSGRTDRDVTKEIGQATGDWLGRNFASSISR